MVDTCHVTGTLITPDGSPLPRVEALFHRLPHEVFVEDDKTGIPREVRAETDGDGNIAVDLIPGEYKVLLIARGLTQYPPFNVGVPDAETAVLADIQDVPPPPSLDDATRAVRDAREARDESREARDEAVVSAQAAADAAQAAEGHAQAAADSAQSAADSAQASASSAQAAATSEQNAATSEGNTSGYATAAGNSASAAATSEQNAANSASAAAGSASAASASASDAADAQQAAEAAAQTATEKAGEAADSADAALAATSLGYGVSIYNVEGVEAGSYYAERYASDQTEQSRVYIEIIDGDPGSSISATLEVDNVGVYGPATVEQGSPHLVDELQIAVPVGVSVLWSFTNVTGDVREVYARSYGRIA